MQPAELVLVIGPPAVGKMTVGHAVCARTDFRLFHNHHTIEPLLEIFGHGTAPFAVLNGEFRRRVLEEAARHHVPLIFTLVWNVDDPADAAAVRALVRPYVRAGLRVSFVELYADLDTRLQRNRGADRIRAKPSKSDLVWSDAHVRDLERYRMNTDPAVPSAADEVLAAHPHLRLDSSRRTPDQAADEIVTWLQRSGGPGAAS